MSGWPRLLRYFGLYAAGIVLLIVVSQFRSTWLFAIATVILLAVAVVAHVRFRPPPGLVVIEIAFGLGFLVGGATLVWLWTQGWADWVGFIGVAAAGFGYRAVMRQIRLFCRLAPIPSMVFGFAVTVAGIAWIWLQIPDAGEPIPWVSMLVAGVAMIASLSIFAEGAIQTLDSASLWSSRNVLLSGIVLFGGAMLAIAFAGGNWTWIAIGAFVIFIGVGSIVSESDYDVAGIVLAAALFWASTPQTASPPEIAADDTRPILVALGDSYISGEGAGSFYKGTNVRSSGDQLRNECRRAPTAYPVLIAENDYNLLSVACSGAVIRNIADRPQFAGEPPSSGGLDQLDHVDALVASTGGEVAAVLLSIGGNDANFSTIGTACIAPGDCTAVAQNWLDDLSGLESRLESVYQEVSDHFLDVPVAVVPYPGPIRETGCSSSALNESEHWFLASYVEQLQSVIVSAARTAGVHVLDTQEVFAEADLRICDAGPAGVNFIDLNPVDGTIQQSLDPTNWFHNSLHPNARGHKRLAEVVSPQLPLGPNPAPSPRDHPIVTLSELMAGRPIAACDLGAKCQDPLAWTHAQFRRAVGPLAAAGFVLATGAWMLWIVGIQFLRGRRRQAVMGRALLD